MMNGKLTGCELIRYRINAPGVLQEFLDVRATISLVNGKAIAVASGERTTSSAMGVALEKSTKAEMAKKRESSERLKNMAARKIDGIREGKD